MMHRGSKGKASLMVGWAIAACLAVAACGGGSSDGVETDTVATDAVTTPAASEPQEPDEAEGSETTIATDADGAEAPGEDVSSDGAATSFQDVQPATIQIIAQGTFRDPEVGLSSGSGSGSGFIISPDGLAVTNNHVVTGAATLEVFIGGDDSASYNARILGVSECNDLALIDIDAPDDLPYLDWYQEDIQPGLDVYAAGFPLGDPEYTLTRGIVAKARAGGDITGTSSIDHTIEHDANIQPGNSGGPLVSTDGLVVGVNYAGGAAATTTAQFYAIASDLAQPVVSELEQGDVESLGINGWAVYDDAAGISGIWVAGVGAGSPAADVGLLPGDIITTMNGLPVGTDGTFKDYCDVIRTAGDRAIAIEVLRYDTSEVLRGELNSDSVLESSFSFADAVEEEVTVGSEPSTGGAGYSGYQTIVDDTGTLTVDLPVEWNDLETSPVPLDDGSEAPFIVGAPDIEGFVGTYDVPGAVITVLPATDDVDAVLAELAPGDVCTDLGTEDYADNVFTGRYQLWSNCDGTSTALVTLVAIPADGSYTVAALLQAVTEADFEALDQLFATFNVVA